MSAAQAGLGAPGGWLTLPHPKSYYAPCGWEGPCADLQTLTNDAMSLGRAAGINFSSYDNVNFVMSNDLDCCAHGGGFYSPVEGKFYGATWDRPGVRKLTSTPTKWGTVSAFPTWDGCITRTTTRGT